MSQTNTESATHLARRILELADSVDVGGLESHVSAKCAVHMGSDDLDRAGWVARTKAFQGGFPDGRHEVQQQTALGDTAVTIGVWKGTHKGAFMGMPATNRPVQSRYILVHKFKDGLLTEVWGQFDSAGMIQQLTAK